jgi:hypothetical protein
MDTVRIEIMIMDMKAHIVSSAWIKKDVNLPNDPFYYLPMMSKYLMNMKSMYPNDYMLPRIRVVNEQTNRIVDMMQ